MKNGRKGWLLQTHFCRKFEITTEKCSIDRKSGSRFQISTRQIVNLEETKTFFRDSAKFKIVPLDILNLYKFKSNSESSSFHDLRRICFFQICNNFKRNFWKSRPIPAKCLMSQFSMCKNVWKILLCLHCISSKNTAIEVRLTL